MERLTFAVFSVHSGYCYYYALIWVGEVDIGNLSLWGTFITLYILDTTWIPWIWKKISIWIYTVFKHSLLMNHQTIRGSIHSPGFLCIYLFNKRHLTVLRNCYISHREVKKINIHHGRPCKNDCIWWSESLHFKRTYSPSTKHQI